MNITEVQYPRRKLDDKCLCLSYAFGSVFACEKSAHMFQKLSYSLADFVSNNSSSDTKAFQCFTVFSGSPTAVHHPLHALLYYTVGIPSVEDSHKHLLKLDGKATITHYHYVRVTKIYTETLHVKKMADLVAVT